jgi:DNA-binding Xre family transcriptional regulator
MYAEKYILEDIERRNLSLDKIKEETGIDVAVLMEEGQELTALDFLNLCIYLRISPEDIRDRMFLNR